VAEMGPRVQEHAGKTCYVVEYDEDQWNKYDEAGQNFAFQRWADKAKPLGCVMVVLRLVPDPIFPSGSNTAPYVARQEQIAPTAKPLSVSIAVTCRIDKFTFDSASELDRLALRRAARAELSKYSMPGNPSYTIMVGDEQLEHGKI
jgi:hypothetical protein